MRSASDLNLPESDPTVRMVAAGRLIFSISALLITSIEPHEPYRGPAGVYALLIAYSLLSLGLYVLASNRSGFMARFRNPYWLDVFVYLTLVSLSTGAGSIFFFFFYFAILNAAFNGGFRRGLLVTGTCTLGFLVVSYLFTVELEVDRLFTRSLSLSILGFMTSYWGGDQIATLNRLRLLRGLGTLSNPRFGVDRTISANLDLLRDFFDAEVCLLVSRRDDDKYELRNCARNGADPASPAEILDGSIADHLLVLPPECTASYDRVEALGFHVGTRVRTLNRSSLKTAVLTQLADRFGAATLLTAPMLHQGSVKGRLFIYGARRFRFKRSDLSFLVLAADRLTLLVENIRLVDRLASDASEAERMRLARDIHDSTIQPYYGLKIGIESLSSLMSNGAGPEVLGRVKKRALELQRLAEEGIDDLRNYVYDLSHGGGRDLELLQSITRFAGKFENATGIDVTIDSTSATRVTDRVGAELFQITSEALSNIRRHTSSRWARVDLNTDPTAVHLRISNAAKNPLLHDFVPGSISMRTRALGGTVHITTADQITTVSVEVPL